MRKESLAVPQPFIEQILAWVTVTIPGAVMIHSVVFVFLLVGARRWSWCFEVLTDPEWKAIKLYYRPAILHFGPFRRWLFARYFAATKARLALPNDTHAYVPVMLTTARGGSEVTSRELLGELKKRGQIWVRGEAGVGKTVLIEYLKERYFSEASPPAARRGYGFLPIFITVRDYPDVSDSVDRPWATEVARLELSAPQSEGAMRFRDPNYFQALLEKGDFASFSTVSTNKTEKAPFSAMPTRPRVCGSSSLRRHRRLPGMSLNTGSLRPRPTS